MSVNVDQEWEEWGSRDPYYAVLTFPAFRRAAMGEAEREAFFASGRAHLDHVLSVCRTRLDAAFQPRRALDFGCGVGRVTLAMASAFEAVVGVDVSESMLREAERNRDAHGLQQVEFVKSDDELSGVEGMFDFIHSFIVFQHMDVPRGRSVFARLIGRLAPGGILAAHFTYAKARHVDSFGKPPARELVPPRRRSKVDGDPVMLMNPYNVSELLFIIQTAGISRLFTEFTDHGGELGVFFFFQK